MRKKPNLSARVEKCGSLLVREPEAYKGRWLNAFQTEGPGCGELHIELGCGKGRFTVETAMAMAAAGQGGLIVALEKSADAMIIAMERAAAQGLSNVRFVNALAEDLAGFFAPGEVSRLYLNFCDPWPSNRHAKRRLTNRRFLGMYMQILRPGGEIYFKTDNLPLFEFSLREFERCGYTLSGVTRDLHKDGPSEEMSDYELKFYNQGTPICKLVALSYGSSIVSPQER